MDTATTSPDPASEATAESSTLSLITRQEGDPAALGDVDAPVLLSMWTDMRCPFCAAFARNTLPVLIDEYVSTGKVRLEVHDVAYFGQQSEDAAVAALAAGEQGKFFEFMQAVYAAAPENTHPDLPREILISFAEKAGVPDIGKFTADLDREDLIEEARTATLTAQSIGVTGVPFFVANGTYVVGAQPLDVFRGFLDEALVNAGQ